MVGKDLVMNRRNLRQHIGRNAIEFDEIAVLVEHGGRDHRDCVCWIGSHRFWMYGTSLLVPAQAAKNRPFLTGPSPASASLLKRALSNLGTSVGPIECCACYQCATELLSSPGSAAILILE